MTFVESTAGPSAYSLHSLCADLNYPLYWPHHSGHGVINRYMSEVHTRKGSDIRKHPERVYSPIHPPSPPPREAVIHCFARYRVNPQEITSATGHYRRMIRPGTIPSFVLGNRNGIREGTMNNDKETLEIGEVIVANIYEQRRFGNRLNAPRTLGTMENNLPVSYPSHAKYRATLRTQQVQFITNKAESAFRIIVDPTYANASDTSAKKLRGTFHSRHQDGMTPYGSRRAAQLELSYSTVWYKKRCHRSFEFCAHRERRLPKSRPWPSSLSCNQEKAHGASKAPRSHVHPR